MTNMLELIKAALWSNQKVTASYEVFNELRQHTVAGLPADLISTMELPSELKAEWQRYVVRMVSYNYHYCHAQECLPITVPYVILKGTTAAKYYPHPEYREMGDIDLMTRREDFDTACDMLLCDGYTEMEQEEEYERERHREFFKNGVSVEIHRFFASLNDPSHAKLLDDQIIENINSSHVLPDKVNGLVLLEHISQHLESGLGLRQIIDWMMFVNQCLPDEYWPAFRPMAKEIGLEKLAMIVTRMCEFYLGLPERGWCAGAEPELCSQLMEYILSCGNFGNKKTTNEAISENLLVRGASAKAAFRLLQQRGLVNWKAAQRHEFLKPVAWIYQLCRYIRRGLHREKAASKLNREFKQAKARRSLIETLGAKQVSKGVVSYKDGKYIKQ